MRRIGLLSLVFWIGLILSLAYAQGDQLNPSLASYIAALKIRIMHVVNTSLTEAQPEGQVSLKLCITHQGLLKEARVGESSGQENLDGIATNVVHKAFPFVPFPPEIKESEVWVDVPIVFDKERMVGLPSVSRLADLPQAAPVLVSPSISGLSKVQVTLPARLKECFQIALENYQPTKIAKEQMDLARLKVNVAERNYYPALTGEYKTSEGKTIADPYKSKSYGLSAEQLLLGLNQVRDSVRREKIGFLMARKNYDKLKNDLSYEVSKSYYELVSQTSLLKHWLHTLEDLKQNIELLARLYKAGLAVPTEFENVQSQYKLISYQAFSAESAVSLAKLALIQAMNLDPSKIEEVDVPVEFGFLTGDLGLNLSECVKMALRFRPEIELWQMTAKSAKLNELINRQENLPKFSLATSYGRSGEAYATQTLEMVDEWSVMGKLTWLWGPSSMEASQTEDRVLSRRITDTTLKTESTTSDIKFSLFDRLNYYSAKKEAQITYHQSLNELNEAKKKVIYEVKEAYLAYARALSGIQTSLARLTFRENELKVIKARTEAGEGSPTELVDAKVNLANEKAYYLRAQGEYYMAVAALDKATGYQVSVTR